MPSKEQLKQGAPDMKAAAKNALIFTMVEQHLTGKKGITQRDQLETVQHAIQLYDTHVDALGHAACMSAVKRFLDMHTIPPAEWNKMTPEQRKKIKDENAEEEAKLTAEKREALQKKREKRRQRAERKRAKKNGAHEHGGAHGDIKYPTLPKEEWEKMTEEEKKAYRMAYKKMKKQAHGNHGGNHGGKHKKQPGIMKQLLKYAKQLWADEVAKMSADQLKFLYISLPTGEGEVNWKQMTLEQGKAKLQNWHKRGLTCLSTKYDPVIAQRVEEGRVYFPKKYDRAEDDRQKTELKIRRTADLEDETNWTDPDKKTAYKAFLEKKRKEKKVHKHMDTAQWNAADANTRLMWIMNETHWEDIIDYEQDATVMEYITHGRVFFKPSGYKDADQSKRLSMHRAQKNWSNVNTKDTWIAWKQELNKAKQSGKSITKTNMLTNIQWDALSGQQRMIHKIANTWVDGEAIPIAELQVRGAEALKKTQAARK